LQSSDVVAAGCEEKKMERERATAPAPTLAELTALRSWKGIYEVPRGCSEDLDKGSWIGGSSSSGTTSAPSSVPSSANSAPSSVGKCDGGSENGSGSSASSSQGGAVVMVGKYDAGSENGSGSGASSSRAGSRSCTDATNPDIAGVAPTLDGGFERPEPTELEAPIEAEQPTIYASVTYEAGVRKVGLFDAIRRCAPSQCASDFALFEDEVVETREHPAGYLLRSAGYDEATERFTTSSPIRRDREPREIYSCCT
jgi:hypothetical protein